jgi:hypothetical protein
VPTEADIREWCGACDADGLVPALLPPAGRVGTAYVGFHRQARTGLRRLTCSHTTARYEQALVDFMLSLVEGASCRRATRPTASPNAVQLGRWLVRQGALVMTSMLVVAL